MANKTVLLTAALATALYAANETMKDSLCRQEELEEKERIEARREEITHRDEERASEGLFHLLTALGRRLNLLELLKRLRRLAYRPNPSLHLPLLNADDENSIDQIVFGAAVALGDGELIEMALQRQIIRSDPALPLTKLTQKSVGLIRQVLNAYKTTHLPGTSVPLPLVDVDSIGTMVSFSLNYTQPHVVFLSTPRQGLMFKRHLEALGYCAETLGLHLFPADAYKVIRTRGSVHFMYQRKKEKNMHILRARPSEQLFLTNYKGDFRITFARDEEGNATGQSLECLANNITPHQPSSEAMEWFAVLSAQRVAAEAGKRLDHFQRQGVSIEHLAVSSGLEGTMLSDMRTSSHDMLNQNRTQLLATLSKQIKDIIPPPTTTVSSTEAKALLAREVESFIEQYSRLLQLSFCIVPTWQGKPPSTMVSETSVTQDGMSFVFTSLTFVRRRLERRLELEERERYE
jgi:hypothetical protein